MQSSQRDPLSPGAETALRNFLNRHAGDILSIQESLMSIMDQASFSSLFEEITPTERSIIMFDYNGLIRLLTELHASVQEEDKPEATKQERRAA